MNERLGEPRATPSGLEWDGDLPAREAAPAAVASDGAPATRGPVGPAPWGLGEIAWVIFIVLVILVAVGTVIAFVVDGLNVEGEAEADARVATLILISQLVLDLGAVGAAAAFSLAKFKVSAADGWGLRRPPQIRFGLCVAVLVASYGALFAYTVVVAALGIDQLEPQNNVPETLFEHPAVLPLTLLLILVAAPVCEEIFFRGFLFSGLWGGLGRWATEGIRFRFFGMPLFHLRFPPGFGRRWLRLGFWPAALLSGFLFSGIHVTDGDLIGLLIPFTIIGTLFAWLRVRTGSLWNPILVHFVFNLIGATASVVNAYG